MSNIKRPCKPVTKFVFPTEENAAAFYKEVQARGDISLIQHPLSKTGDSSRILDQVWVTGCGSLLLDMNLERDLIAVAEKEGGSMIA